MKVFVIFPVNFSEIQQFTPPELLELRIQVHIHYEYTKNEKIYIASFCTLSWPELNYRTGPFQTSVSIFLSLFLTFSCNEVNHSEIKLSKIYSGSLFFIIGVIFCVAISYVISFNCYTLNLISC